MRFVPATDPSQPLTLIARRKPDREYDVDAAHGKLWIHTNDDHVNFRLAEADSAIPANGATVIAGSDRVYLTGVTAYRDHLAISSRVDGLDQLILRTYAGEETRIPFAEASYSAGFAGNPEFAPEAYRLGYSSMVTPATVYDYHPATGELSVLKVQEIPSGYDASLYADRAADDRRRATAPRSRSRSSTARASRRTAGQALPLRLWRLRHRHPAVLSTATGISLLDRGFAYAIAHIRGGDDLGYDWYLDGKLDQADQHLQRLRRRGEGLVDAGFTHAPDKSPSRAARRAAS